MNKENIKAQIVHMLNGMNKQQLKTVFTLTYRIFIKGH